MPLSDRDKAKAKITRWKKRLYKGYQIAQHVGVRGEVISRIYSGNGEVSQDSLSKVLAAEELK